MSKLKKETIKIQVYCHTGYVGCNHDYIEEFDKEEWSKLSEEERENWLNELAQDNMGNHIDYGAFVINEDKDE
jgi:hypothetical protein